MTAVEIEAYTQLRTNFPRLDRQAVLFMDCQDLLKFPDSDLEELERYCKACAKRYEGTGEILGMVCLTNTEEMFGYARMLQTYVGTEYVIHVFLDRDEADACVQKYLA